MSKHEDPLPTAAVRGVLPDELVTVVSATCRQRLPRHPLCGRCRPPKADTHLFKPAP